MSGDLIEDLQDRQGVSINLTMNVNGFAWLEWYDPYTHESFSFELAPNASGIKAAETSENAIRAWREHIKDTLLT